MSDGFLDEEAEEEGEEGVIDVDATEVESVEEEGAGLIKPATDDLQQIKETYDEFQRIKSELLTSDDRESVSGNTFITKSGWRKIATAFNISVETVEEHREVTDGIVQWRVKAKATAPNGTSATGVGMTTSNESNFMSYIASVDDTDKGEFSDQDDVFVVDGAYRKLKDPKQVKEHDLFSTASTRAKNRAISDLVGGGEVSHEELEAEDFIG